MIDVSTYAKEIEDGLNALISDLDNDDADIRDGYRFHVCPDIMEYKKAERVEGRNKVLTFINCLLESTPSENATTANGLVLLVENFTLQIAVPTGMQRVTPSTMQQQQSIDGESGVFLFVEKIKQIINSYFKLNEIETLQDDDGNVYACGFSYTQPSAGYADFAPVIGEYISLEAYITVNIVQNGVNSKNVAVEIDGESTPYQVLRPNRSVITSAVVTSDGTGASKAITTATTLALDIALPATTGTITQQFNEFLVHGDINVAHFVKFSLNTNQSRYYLMTYGDISAQAEGVQNVGLTMPLIECVNNISLLDFPDYMKVLKISVDDLSDDVISVHITRTGGDNSVAFLVGRGSPIIVDRFLSLVNSPINMLVNRSSFDYDDETDEYTTYVILCPVDKSANVGELTAEVS